MAGRPDDLLAVLEATHRATRGAAALTFRWDVDAADAPLLERYESVVHVEYRGDTRLRGRGRRVRTRGRNLGCVGASRFDLVVGALADLSVEDALDFLREMLRVARPGATVVAVLSDSLPRHMVRELVRANGARVVDVSDLPKPGPGLGSRRWVLACE